MTPPDNNPEIPSFKKQDDKEKKTGGAPLLGRGAAGGAKPVLKIRGLGSGTTLIERLKQFKKKDIAFILSGLGVLFMAPLAEHFILGPGDDSKMLNRGFDSKGNVFSEANPYEPGTGGFSPGGLPGQGTDVITPLNVRDPSALVMGPGANQTPPAASAPKEEKKDASSWKDALVEAGRAGARGASASAGLPTPRGSLSGALRGLSALGGGGGGGGPSYQLPPISASNVPNKSGGGKNMLNVAGAPGYKGVAERGISSGGNEDALKAAAQNAAGLFNRAGSAAGNLDAAAKEAIPTGGGRSSSDGTGPGGGASSKDPGGNQNKDNKSMGESLAFLRAKMLMEKQLDLDFKKKEWREFEFYKTIQQQLMQSAISGIIGKGFFDPTGSMIADFIKGHLGGTAYWGCLDAQTHTRIIMIPDADVKSCRGGGDKDHPNPCPYYAQQADLSTCQSSDPMARMDPAGKGGGAKSEAIAQTLPGLMGSKLEGGRSQLCDKLSSFCANKSNSGPCEDSGFTQAASSLVSICTKDLDSANQKATELYDTLNPSAEASIRSANELYREASKDAKTILDTLGKPDGEIYKGGDDAASQECQSATACPQTKLKGMASAMDYLGTDNLKDGLRGSVRSSITGGDKNKDDAQKTLNDAKQKEIELKSRLDTLESKIAGVSSQQYQDQLRELANTVEQQRLTVKGVLKQAQDRTTALATPNANVAAASRAASGLMSAIDASIAAGRTLIKTEPPTTKNINSAMRVIDNSVSSATQQLTNTDSAIAATDDALKNLPANGSAQ